VQDRVRDLRPASMSGFEVGFEMPPGEQAQVDFARFDVEFTDEPGAKRMVWLSRWSSGPSKNMGVLQFGYTLNRRSNARFFVPKILKSWGYLQD
jgi:hypothetical protein